jgi:hypothetical protein
VSIDLADVATWGVTSVVVVYLALQNGGYDLVERSQIGIAVWWIVLLGSAVGAIAVRPSRAEWLLLGALIAFAAWTALSLTWTDSAERTTVEVARAVTYLGVFALAIASRGRWRALYAGIVTAVSVVVVLAVLSRLEPNLFPDQIAPSFFPQSDLEPRLAYPLNYSTGLAALAAMTAPLLLSVTAAARWLWLKALAAALIPVAFLTIWLTASSLAIPLSAAALVAYLAFTNDRPLALATMIVSAIGTALLIGAIEQRDALDSGVVTPDALREGDSMLAVLLVVCTGVGLIQAGLAIIDRATTRPAWAQGSSRKTAIVCAGLALVALIATTLTPLRGEISDGWNEFTAQSELDKRESSRFEQIVDLSSRGRYQFWESAVDAGESHPLEGIGAGTFEFWWAENRTELGFARDAHSLFLESFAELGVVGLALIVVLILGVVPLGWRRLVRARPPTRSLAAGTGAAFVVFIVAAAVDWMWELAVLPVIALALAAIWLAAGDVDEADEPPGTPTPEWGLGARLAIAAVSVIALAVIAGPLASTTAVQASQSAAADGDLNLALDRDADAEAIQPYAATPDIQRALLLEQTGDLDGAIAAARAATADEPTNWRNWLVLARIEVRAGDAEAALRDYRHAKSLNPRSPIFSTPGQ